MIKAISRQILEVSDTGSAYFDHAWLMVSPEFSTASPENINSMAEDYLSSLDAPFGIRRSRAKRRLLRAASLLVSAAAGALAAVMIISHAA